jgi:hypothetical protein
MQPSGPEGQPTNSAWHAMPDPRLIVSLFTMNKKTGAAPTGSDVSWRILRARGDGLLPRRHQCNRYLHRARKSCKVLPGMDS